MLGIVAATVGFTALGVWAERRSPARASRLARRGMELTLFFLVPFIVFFNLARASIDVELLGAIGLGYLATTVVALASWQWSVRVLRLGPPQTGSVLCCMLIGNTGYLGFPLLVVALGGDAVADGIVYDLAVSTTALVLVSPAVAAAMGTKSGEGARERAGAFLTRNPALYAAIAGVLAPQALAPDVMVDASHVLLTGLLPFGFFAVGTALAEEDDAGEISLPPRLSAPVATVVVARMVAIPGLMLAISAPLFDLPAAALLLAAMPSGINSLVLSHVYGLDNRLVAESIAWTTAIALVGVLVALALTG